MRHTTRARLGPVPAALTKMGLVGRGGNIFLAHLPRIKSNSSLAAADGLSLLGGSEVWLPRLDKTLLARAASPARRLQ